MKFRVVQPLPASDRIGAVGLDYRCIGRIGGYGEYGKSLKPL